MICIKLLGVRNEGSCHLNNVELGFCCQSPLITRHSVRGVFVLLIYVVLDYIQLVAWCVVSGGK